MSFRLLIASKKSLTPGKETAYFLILLLNKLNISSFINVLDFFNLETH